MFRWGRAANEEARAKREARLVEIGDIKNIPVRSTFWVYLLSRRSFSILFLESFLSKKRSISFLFLLIL